MEYRTKQRILNRRISKGQKTFNELSNILNLQARSKMLMEAYAGQDVK